MNILLIRPKPHRRTIGLQSMMICEPLELMTLAAVLRKNGHSVTVIDMILEPWPVTRLVKKKRPDIVGITGYISHIGVIKDYARRIKSLDPAINIGVGGVHAAVCPHDFADEQIDCVCRSAGDFYRFAGCDDPSDMLPDRSLPERYLKRYYYLFQSRCALIKTSYGCPYSCGFCFCKEIAPYSARSVDDVIRELLTIPQREVYIVDDNFLFNKPRLLDFADKLEKNRIDKRFLVYGRADFIAANEDVIARLADVGLGAVIVGLESASQEELDRYQKRSRVEDNIAAVGILKKHGIECYATIILGTGWDKSDFSRLREFLKKLDIAFVNLQPFTPMPGTPYFEQFSGNLIIPYSEPEKWDMAHLVVQPSRLSVRQYYLQILKLYYQITVTPGHSLYMIRRYGLNRTLRLSLGAMKISIQYLLKIIKGG